MARLKKSQMVSAQVVLRPPGGGQPADVEVTAANLERIRPPVEAVERVRRYFAGAGFEVGELVGNSFSITAPAARFEKVFGRPVEGFEGGVGWGGEGGPPALELPAEAMPQEVAREVAAVTFTPPPDFGPTDFGGGEGGSFGP